MTKETERQNVVFGIALIVATALTISVQDLVFKLFSSNLTLWQIFTLRGLIALPILVAIGGARGGIKAVLQWAFGLWPLLRGICLTMTFLTFNAAIPFLSLSTVGAANYIAPIFVALLSAYVIGEKVSRLGWSGVFFWASPAWLRCCNPEPTRSPPSRSFRSSAPPSTPSATSSRARAVAISRRRRSPCL